MNPKWINLRKKIQTAGLFGALSWSAYNYLHGHIWLGRRYLFVTDLERYDPDLKEKEPAFQFKQLSVDDMRLLNHPYSSEKMDALEERERNGASLVALIGQANELLSFSIFRAGHTFYEDNFGKYINLEKREIYCQETSTNPKFRNKGLAYYLCSLAFLHYKEKGYTREFHFIDAANIPSIRMSRSLESKPIKVYVCFLWKGLTRCTWLISDKNSHDLVTEKPILFITKPE